MKRRDYVSDEEVEKCMIIAADLVDRYGDEMIPLLHRLEGEYAFRRKTRDAPSRSTASGRCWPRTGYRQHRPRQLAPGNVEGNPGLGFLRSLPFLQI